MRVNQNGEQLEESTLYASWAAGTHDRSDEERDTAICLLCEHLGVEIVRTNATKHGNTELILRKAA